MCNAPSYNFFLYGFPLVVLWPVRDRSLLLSSLSLRVNARTVTVEIHGGIFVNSRWSRFCPCCLLPVPTTIPRVSEDEWFFDLNRLVSYLTIILSSVCCTLDSQRASRSMKCSLKQKTGQPIVGKVTQQKPFAINTGMSYLDVI